MRITIAQSLSTSVAPSPNVLQVASMFGLGVDETRSMTLVPPTTIDLLPGHVVFVTGPSGSGKSAVLRLICDTLAHQPQVRVICFDRLPPLPEQPLIDSLAALCPSLERALHLLSVAGLADAFVMLRSPSQLSDGQRYRFRLAQTMAAVETGPPEVFHVVLADEFGATLDRLTAAVIARNIRKWSRRLADSSRRVCFVAATSHDDLLEPLEPDVLIEKHLGARIDILTRSADAQTAASPTNP
jgi:hypothetical protein